MSRETDNGHVCGQCGEIVFHDSCLCTDEEPVTVKSSAIFIAKIILADIIIVVLVVMWLVL